MSCIGKKSRGGSGFVKKSARLSTLHKKVDGNLQVLDFLPNKKSGVYRCCAWSSNAGAPDYMQVRWQLYYRRAAAYRRRLRGA
eukprot:2346653-Pleurochrysis_carterae.AAC.1